MPPHLFGQTIPFCQGTFEKFFILALLKQCAAFPKANKNLPLYLFGAGKPEIQPYFIKFLFISFATED